MSRRCGGGRDGEFRLSETAVLGRGALDSSDPAPPPLIDPNHWSDPLDRAKAVHGLKFSLQILSREAPSPFIHREVLPGHDLKSDDDHSRHASRQAQTNHHPAGTRRMGGDSKSITDPRTRVREVDGPRVADASVNRRLVSANTNATAIMIAEAATDMIREDHGLGKAAS